MFRKAVPGLFTSLDINTWEDECAKDIKLKANFVSCLLLNIIHGLEKIFMVHDQIFSCCYIWCLLQWHWASLGLLIPRHLASWWILVLKVKLLQFPLAGTMILWINWYECHELQKIFNLGRQNIFNLYKRNLKESQKWHSVILFISLIFEVRLY